jgi:hypothetical protein
MTSPDVSLLLLFAVLPRWRKDEDRESHWLAAAEEGESELVAAAEAAVWRLRKLLSERRSQLGGADS